MSKDIDIFPPDAGDTIYFRGGGSAKIFATVHKHGMDSVQVHLAPDLIDDGLTYIYTDSGYWSYLGSINHPFDIVDIVRYDTGNKGRVPKIIGIAGAKHSGKSTVAKHLSALYGAPIIPTVKPLKDMLRAIGLTEEEIEGILKELPSDKLCGRTPRWAMQSLGHEWGRKCMHEDFWLNLWERQIQGMDTVIADNIRYPNEVDKIKELGGVIVKIRRPSVEGDSDHETELYVQSLRCDFEVFNDSDKDTLVKRVLSFCTK